MKLGIPVTALCILVSGAVAQKTWIVGSGTLTLAQTIAAAKDGDVVRVQGGMHACPVTIKKALTFIGEGSVEFRPATGKRIWAQSIGAGKTLSFRNIRFATIFPQAEFYVTNSPGTVVLDGVRFVKSPGTFGIVIWAENVGLFVLRECSSPGTVRIRNSRTFVEGGTYQGASTIYSNPAFDFFGGDLSLTDVTATGSSSGRTPSGSPAVAAAPRVTIGGGATNLTGGAGQYYGSSAVSGRGELILANNAKLTGGRSAAAYSWSGTVMKKDRPTLRSLNAPSAGSNWRYILRSKPRLPFTTYLSMPGPGWIWIGMDPMMLQPALIIPLHTGTQAATGATTFSLPIPGTLDARHLTLVVQSIEVHTGHAEITNPIFLGQR